MVLIRSRSARAALALLLALTATAAGAAKKANLVTTTEDLAALCREVGGDRVAVEAIARGYQDPHFVEPKPSFLLKLHKADLLVLVGLQLEIGWLHALISQSRNARIQLGSAGYLDVSSSAEILEIATAPVTRAMGDAHPMGNPHYWLDPENGRRIARTVEQKLSEIQSSDSAYFAERYRDFDRRLREAEKGWEQRMAPYRGRQVITYHRSWPNFARRFGLVVVDYVEPKPGIPPTPSHVLNLIGRMKREAIKLILVEPYFDLRTPESIARQTGAEVVVLLPSVGGVEEVKNYFQLFDFNINLLANVFARVK